MTRQRKAGQYLHKVSLEEVLQLPLSCRIREVADVQAATFGSTGEDGIVGRLGVVSLVVASEGGVGQSVRDVVHGVRRSIGYFLNDGRHVDGVESG